MSNRGATDGLSASDERALADKPPVAPNIDTNKFENLERTLLPAKQAENEAGQEHKEEPEESQDQQQSAPEENELYVRPDPTPT